MALQWRARAGVGGVVVVETRAPGEAAWAPARVMGAEEADRLGEDLRRAAQEARRRALSAVTPLSAEQRPERGRGAALGD